MPRFSRQAPDQPDLRALSNDHLEPGHRPYQADIGYRMPVLTIRSVTRAWVPSLLPSGVPRYARRRRRPSLAGVIIRREGQ